MSAHVNTLTALAVAPAIAALLFCADVRADDVAAKAASGVRADSGRSHPRLRFRNGGPTCMCGNGLSESDIENAVNKRRSGHRSPASAGGGPDTSSSNTKHSSQGGSDEHQGRNPKGSQP
jgi:hypothetical protein